MTIWVDAQLSPAIAKWIRDQFGHEVLALRDIGLRDAEDLEIYNAARQADALVITKDRDFVYLQHRLGPPPNIIWLTCGNTSNVELKRLFIQLLDDALKLILSGETIVEIA